MVESSRWSGDGGAGGAVAADGTSPASAFEALCRSAYPRLVGSLSLYCGDHDVAEDMAQEALARAWRDWTKVARMDAPEMWVYRTAFNLTNSWYRRVRTARRKSDGIGSPRALEPDLARSLAVRAAVEALPRRQREAVTLRYYSDLSVEAAARVMGCAPGTVRALTAQGVAALRATAGLTLREDDA